MAQRGEPGVRRAGANDVYPSNTALYADPGLRPGRDYRRRHHRVPGMRTTILAPHGGELEPGTSELCLAIAGHDPVTALPGAAPVYGYWMFEALRPENSATLHVTSARCDDPLALAQCAGALNALAVHGCYVGELPGDGYGVLVGGAGAVFRELLLRALRDAGFAAHDAAGHPRLGGSSPRNIVNRARLGLGGQLEVSSTLRNAMFHGGAAGSRAATTVVFRDFVRATRLAVAGLEAAQSAVAAD